MSNFSNKIGLFFVFTILLTLSYFVLDSNKDFIDLLKMLGAMFTIYAIVNFVIKTFYLIKEKKRFIENKFAFLILVLYFLFAISYISFFSDEFLNVFIFVFTVVSLIGFVIYELVIRSSRIKKEKKRKMKKANKKKRRSGF